MVMDANLGGRRMQERQRKWMEKRVESYSEYCVCGIEYY